MLWDTLVREITPIGTIATCEILTDIRVIGAEKGVFRKCRESSILRVVLHVLKASLLRSHRFFPIRVRSLLSVKKRVTLETSSIICQ